MKRMREISIACIALMLLLTAVTIPHTLAVHPPTAYELTAGGGNPNSAIDVGDVYVWEGCGGELYVQYVIAEGWCLTETHLHVASSPDDIPQTEAKGKGKNLGGNPIPGKFTYKYEYDPCVTEVIYGPLDTGLFIAAHAVVCIDDMCVPECETAWAGMSSCGSNVATGIDFPGKNWATYITYPYPVNGD